MESMEEQRAKKFYELRQSGTTVEEIASTYFLPVARVKSIIRDYEKGNQLPRAKTHISSSTPRMIEFAAKAEEFRNLRLDGITTEDIASKYGITAASVSQAIASYERRYKLPSSAKSHLNIRPKNSPTTRTINVDRRAEEFRNLKLKGATLEDIASMNGLTRERVRQIIDKYERKYNLPNSIQAGRELAKKARQADREEHKDERKHERHLQSKHFAETIQLDANLVGRFLRDLGDRSIYYRFYGKNKKRKDGTPFPGTTNPTCVEFAIQEGGKSIKKKLHHWVLYQYGMEVPEGMDCHHIDSDVTNNMRENLELLSSSEHGRLTMQEQMRKGPVRKSSLLRSLSIGQVEEIRAMYQPRVTPVRDIAKKYGVAVQVVHNAIHGLGAYSDINPATRHALIKPVEKIPSILSPRTRKAILSPRTRKARESIDIDGIPHKHCSGPCGRILPATIEFFYHNKGAKSGLESQCKECTKQRSLRNQKSPKARERDNIRHREKYRQKKNAQSNMQLPLDFGA